MTYRLFDSSKGPDFRDAIQAGQELFQLARGWRERLGADRGLLDQYLVGILQAMTDTTNALLTAGDGYETALSPLRDIIQQIKAGKVAEAEKHPFYPKAKAYMDAHPLPQDSLQHELYYLALFTEYVPFAVKRFLDECDATFKELLEEENIIPMQKALLASDAGITEDDLGYLHGLISRAVGWIPPSGVFIQGMVDQMLLTLAGQDENSGEYILQRLMDGALDGAFLK
jgi:hypothetical protein